MSTSEVRVRFAPSPTGYLHVGGARTALYDFLYARNRNGTFVLRVEDTDLERSTEESLRMQLNDLQWLGLEWDEGPDPDSLEDKGSYGPYRQSQRGHIYRQFADQLISEGKAYHCFLTDKEIESLREEAQKTTGSPQYESPYRETPLEEAQSRINNGESYTVRFKRSLEKPEWKLNDLIRGEVSWPSNMVGDFVLIRSNGMPVYNFCCVVDDALMKITHVFRAEEHLNNTLRQLMLYEALGFEIPEFGHMSIILGEDKQKLSKRHGATSCHEYQQKGYLPEALINFIALLGWSSPEGKEILSRKELIEQFSVERLNSAPAVFDPGKFQWMNGVYIREAENVRLWNLLKPILTEENINLPEDSAWVERALNLMKPRMETLRDAIELFRPLSLQEFKIAPESQESLSWESSKAVIGYWIDLLNQAGHDFLTEEQFEDLQNKVKQNCQVKGKHLFMPIRVAVIGKPQGADLKLLVPLLSKQELLRRAEIALKNTEDA